VLRWGLVPAALGLAACGAGIWVNVKDVRRFLLTK
jgi:hypothetical protein